MRLCGAHYNCLVVYDSCIHGCPMCRETETRNARIVGLEATTASLNSELEEAMLGEER